MNYKLKNSSFSLTEVLIAVGILSVGMVFVAGVFPAGIYLATVATERTIAAVAADEAFAKVRIYGIDLSKLSDSSLTDFNSLPAAININTNEFEYPSAETNEPNQYCWSALCRRVESAPGVVDPNLVQVTVFVSRKANPNLKYPDGSGGTVDRPMPVKVSVSPGGNANELQINGGPIIEAYINDGYTIVDDATGRIYRVLERYKVPNDSIILLDGNWGRAGGGDVWVVPPPTGGGRHACIAVYQKLIRF
jgi:type II secretory pathway pseudopilin PulG